MRTPASIAGHPIHPMLVPIPIGLWLFSLVCDVVYAAGWGGEIWRSIAFYNMVGGVIGALMAAIPGLIDLISLHERPKKTALVHMSINLTIVALYVVNILLRIANPDVLRVPLVLSIVAVAMLTVSGWLGGKMVYELGVAVDNAEAPTSIPLGKQERIRT
jgi:uncharacterized membrane protein